MRIVICLLVISFSFSPIYAGEPASSWLRFLTSPVVGTELYREFAGDKVHLALYAIYASEQKAPNLKVFLVEPNGSAHPCEWFATYPEREYALEKGGFQILTDEQGNEILRDIPDDVVQKIFRVPGDMIANAQLLRTVDGEEVVWEEIIPIMHSSIIPEGGDSCTSLANSIDGVSDTNNTIAHVSAK